MRYARRIGLTLALVSLLTSTILTTGGCVKPSAAVAALPPASQTEYKLLQVVKVINDVTDSAIAANHAGVLRDQHELIVLSINKQVLEIIEAHPDNFKELAMAAVKNAMSAFAPDVHFAVSLYIERLLLVIQEFR